MKTACFTGHRFITWNTKIIQDLYSFLNEIICSGVLNFYAGGALGWDMICENAVIELREKHPIIKLHLILPCPPEEQTLKWTTTQKREFNRILDLADSVEIISEHYSNGCFRLRNIRLVEYFDLCLCYMTNSRSGTGQTVRLAQNKGISVKNFAIY